MVLDLGVDSPAGHVLASSAAKIVVNDQWFYMVL